MAKSRGPSVPFPRPRWQNTARPCAPHDKHRRRAPAAAPAAPAACAWLMRRTATLLGIDGLIARIPARLRWRGTSTSRPGVGTRCLEGGCKVSGAPLGNTPPRHACVLNGLIRLQPRHIKGRS
ncbi:hypothetical protein CALCODRAFT_228840 [Calocera cornea HHB12733]|uniref:Uncharacterized protein n=1 Tax=Calocera cornea HHB12733 TaxID=1353952 RepID=A0A165H3L5_9BASI|nr:hypothetical protein CALCODRAFT_228840 [Calocera cornea HHB12733]